MVGMKSRKFWIILTTVILVGASATLIAMRFLPWFRNKDLSTRIETEVPYQPAAGEKLTVVEDWPRWRGPRGDGISRENAGESWPADAATSRLRWRASVGIGYSSPIAAAGRIYLFSLHNQKDTLTCFDALTGNVIWSDSSEQGWTGDYPGARATPNIAGDAIYTFGGQGELTCRDLATGKPRWRQNVMELAGCKPLRWGAASSPLVDGNLIYVQTGERGPVAVALNAQSGALAWKSAAGGLAGYAAPRLVDVAGTKQLIIFGGEAVYGMDPASGRTIWQQEWRSNFGVAASSPVYRDGRLLVTTGYGKGALILRLTPGGVEQERQVRELDCKFPGMVLDGDNLYAITESSGGHIACLGWNDGVLRWRGEDDELKLSFGGSFVKAAGDKMVLLSEEGMLGLASVSPQGIRLVSQFKAASSEAKVKVWSAPLLYGGCVYVKGARHLMCYKLSDPPKAPATAPM
jgi:outer membrane protein assembly factor BamB